MLSGPKAPFQGPVYLTSNPLLPATWVEGALLLALGTFVGLPFKPVGVVVCFAWVVAFIYGKRRWQVYALDVAAAAIAAFVWLPAWLPAEFVVYFRGFIAVLLAAGLVANALMPVPSLPKPTGPYSVAVHDVFLQRNGLEFRTRVLYPAKLSKHAEPVPYLFHGSNTSAGLASFLGWPAAALGHLLHVGTHGVLWSDPDGDITPAMLKEATLGDDEGLPILIFSHGLAGFPEIYSVLTAELASRGYLVLVPEHRDGSAAYAQVAWEQHGLPYSHLTQEEKDHWRLSHAKRTKQLMQRSAEIGVLLEMLHEFRSAKAKLQSGKKLKPLPMDLQHFRDVVALTGDLDNVFIAGHSFGGATAALSVSSEACDYPIGADDVQSTLRNVGSDDPSVAWAAFQARAQRSRSLALQRQQAKQRKKGSSAAVGGVRPRIPLRAAVLLDPWTFPLPPTVMAEGLGGVPTLTIFARDFASDNMTRNWRNAVLLASATDRAAVAGAYSGVSASDPRVAGAVAQHGLLNGTDWHCLPTVPLSQHKTQPAPLDVTRTGSPSVSTLGVHPETLIAVAGGLEHNNFCDISVLAPSFMSRGPGHIGPAHPLHSLTFVADAMDGYFASNALNAQLHSAHVQWMQAAAEGLPASLDTPAPRTRAMLTQLYSKLHASRDPKEAYKLQLWGPRDLVSLLQADEAKSAVKYGLEQHSEGLGSAPEAAEEAASS